MTWIIDDLQNLVDYLSGKGPIFGPVPDQEGNLAFQLVSQGAGIELDIRTDISARNLFQPETHYYLEFQNEPGSQPVLRDFEASNRILIGLRPCDMVGVRVQERVFSQSESFRALRAGTVIVGYLCHRYESFCFCDSVGINPRETQGMDLALFRTQDGSLHLSSLTDRGSNLMEGSPFSESEAQVEPIPAGEKVLQPLPENIDSLLKEVDEKVWDRVSFACVNCNVCTYICPTCHCFTITDEVFQDKGARAAVWDSCQSRTFTKEASGHNPRESKTARSKQRILHKFSYYPSSAEGTLMCSGCGRCISSCPAGRNLVEDLLMLAGEVR